MLMVRKIDDRPLLIGVSARALFDLDMETAMLDGGLDEYRAYQREHRNEPLKPGIAYPFVKRMLSLNLLDADGYPPLV